MKARLDRGTIALRAAKEFQDGDYVNLGGGIPTLCRLFIPEGKSVVFHSENGLMGYGPILTEEDRRQWDFDLTIAGGEFVAPLPGMCITDHATSFAIVRGGHLDVTVLGALQVSERGDLANWATTEGISDALIGGAMDMPVGVKKVIITMEHTTKEGKPKILKECYYPLTARGCVDLIVTDIAVIEVTEDGLVLKEVAPGWTPEEVQVLTEPRLKVAEDLREIEL